MRGTQSLQEQKQLLRKELRQKLENLGPQERTRRSEAILKQLFSHPKFSSAKSLLTYIALGTEVETGPILEEARKRGKRVYAPRVDPSKKRILAIELTDPRELERGSYGILEPPSDPWRGGEPADLELVVVPGVGFDREGGRLGRGEGYFDHFLKEAKKAYKIGLAFECQVVKQVPRGANDVAVDEVLIG